MDEFSNSSFSIRYHCFTGHFYGFIPDSGKDRLIMRGAMLLLASSQLLSRSMGYALIGASIGKRYVIFEIALEIFVYLLYKVMRRDFYYWMDVHGVTRFLISCIMRALVKITADFTCLLQLR